MLFRDVGCLDYIRIRVLESQSGVGADITGGNECD